MSQRHYQVHLKSITPAIPPALARLARQFTLHDDRISQVNIVARGPSLRDALVTISRFRDGCHGVTGLLILHLIDLQGVLPKAPSRLDIMFFDVEMVSASVFQLSFALDEGTVWRVKFRDFGYYLHDYQTHAPEVRAHPVVLREPRANGIRH